MSYGRGTPDTDKWEQIRQLIGITLGRSISERYFSENSQMKFVDTTYEDVVGLPPAYLKRVQLLRRWQKLMDLEKTQYMNSAIERIITQGLNKNINRLHSSIRVPMNIKDNISEPKFKGKKTKREPPKIK